MIAIITGTRPEPPGAWTATLAFGYRAPPKIRHVPEQLFDVLLLAFALLLDQLPASARSGGPLLHDINGRISAR